MVKLWTSYLSSQLNHSTLHIILHFLVPAVVTFLFYKQFKLKAFLILIAAFVIDLDHLLAIPLFDPNRCSINFHPLHTYWAIGSYFILLFIPKMRIFAIGLLIHIALDFVDCFFMTS